MKGMQQPAPKGTAAQVDVWLAMMRFNHSTPIGDGDHLCRPEIANATRNAIVVLSQRIRDGEAGHG
jgi:hypothetical protein